MNQALNLLTIWHDSLIEQRNIIEESIEKVEKQMRDIEREEHESVMQPLADALDGKGVFGI